MEINPKRSSESTPFDPEGVDLGNAGDAVGPGMAAPSPAADVDSLMATRSVADPLQATLTEMVRGKDLSDPQVYAGTGRQVLHEILTNLFGDTLFQSLDADDLLDTFQGFIQDDPIMKEVFHDFLNDLARPDHT